MTSYPIVLSPRLAPDPAKTTGGRIVAALRRRIWLIALCAVLGGVAAYAVSLTLPRRYTAYGAVVLAAEHFAIPELQGALRATADSDPMLLVRTELQALSSPQLVGEVVEQLHLAARAEFNPVLADPDVLKRAISWVSGWLGIGDRSSRPAEPASAEAQRRAVLAEAIHHLTVFNDNRSLVVTIGFTSEDPQLSADFVNRLVHQYRAARLQQRKEANEDANGALLGRIAQLNSEIAGLEKQTAKLRETNQYVGLRAGSVGQQQVEDLVSTAAKASLDRSQAQAVWERAATLVRKGAADQVSGVLTSDTISKLREQEATAARAYAEMNTHHGPDYPGVRQAGANLQSVRSEIAQQVKRIIDSLQDQLTIARQNEAEAQQQLATARAAAVTNTDVQSKINDIGQEIASRRQLVETLQVSLQRTMSEPSAQTPDVSVLSAAQPPDSASSPKPKLAGAMGAAAGSVFGMLLVLAPTRGGFASEAGAAAGGLPVFAVLPNAAGRRRRALQKLTTRSDGDVAETLCTLRLRLRACAKSGAPRVVALIPAQSTRDGAELALAFARLAAAGGERVLLIEGNLQAPMLSSLLNIQGCDLAEVLDGSLHWRDALTHDTQSPLDLLLANRDTASAHTLLQGMRFQNLLAEAREDYHLIVLSAASTELAPASALTLANCADASVLIVDNVRGRSREVGRFVEDLMMISTGPVAAIITEAA